MRTISNFTRVTYRVKGSKFIGFLYPTSSLDRIETVRNEVEGEHPSATHHCYAYRMNPSNLQEFRQDDGEPSGSAGTPILNQLRSAKLINTICIVVRYFGGTKLGIPGLIEAYGTTTSLGIQQADLLDVHRIQKIRISYPYPEQSHIDTLKNHWNLIELEASYLEKVTITFGCDKNYSKAFISTLEKESQWRSLSYEVLDEGLATR